MGCCLIGLSDDLPRSRARQTEQSESDGVLMCNQTGIGTLIAIIGFVVLIDLSVANGQIGGAVQYPPLTIGDDAQPPPPAGMVPQPVSPRRIEFGFSGPSLPPVVNPPYRIYPDTDRLPKQAAPLGGASPVPPSTGSGN